MSSLLVFDEIMAKLNAKPRRMTEADLDLRRIMEEEDDRREEARSRAFIESIEKGRHEENNLVLRQEKLD